MGTKTRLPKGVQLKIQKLKPGQAVIIDWADTKSLIGWTYSPEKKRLPGYIRSLGFVVQHNDECVTITSSFGERGESLDDLSIPTGCITELEVLEDFSLGKG